MLENIWKKEAEGDRLKDGDRIGQAVSIVVILIVAWFLLSHWWMDSGFYTPEFSDLDALVLFVPLLWGILPAIYRTLVARKNSARPLDVIGSILFILSSAYFLGNFHFNMDRFAEPFPEFLRFLIDWIDEGWAKFFLVLGVVGGLIAVGWTSMAYIKVREILARPK